MFGFQMGGFVPQMPMQQQIMPQYQPQVAQTKPTGRWITAKDYAEVQSTAIPADGSQIIFMLENEPVFYTATMQNGQKMVQGYRFTVMNGEDHNEKQAVTGTEKNTTEERIAKLEQFASKMKELLGDDCGESIPSKVNA